VLPSDGVVEVKAREDGVVREDRVYRAGVKMIVRDLKLGRGSVVAGVDNDVKGEGSACTTGIAVSDMASSRRMSETDSHVVTRMPRQGVRCRGSSCVSRRAGTQINLEISGAIVATLREREKKN
jgi:hypothetical protein